jgi:hypothetical protein
MPKKVSTIKIKSRKLKAPEPVSDDETIQFDSDDVQQSGSESEASEPPTPPPKTRAATSKPAAKKPADSSSVASSRASKASTSTSSTANTKKTAKAGRGYPSPADAVAAIEHQEQRKLTKAQRLAAETAYAQAIADHAAAIKAKTEALNADYKLKQMSLADTRAERQRLMSRLVL